jgi:2-polyprenyl-3-methyl-5-hydroxy-6-metoxy-1,4-benzoquinol methylase
VKFQEDYAHNFPSVRDMHTRRQKAKKILQALTRHLQRPDLKGLRCLDLGCSVGVISRALSESQARVTGLDIDVAAMRGAPEGYFNPAFVVGDAGAAPFPGECFDVIVCSQVYEHVPSLELLVREIHRLLKLGGVCFFSGPNRWAIVEEHYFLPFLSWLPRSWANFYVRACRRGSEYYEQPRSASELRRALSAFVIYDLTPELLLHPQSYGMETEVGRVQRLAGYVPTWGWPILGKMVPNFNWLLVKAFPSDDRQ